MAGIRRSSLESPGPTVYLGVRAIHNDARRLAGSEQTRSEAVEELRSQVLGTGDPRYRDEISQCARMFDKAEEQLVPVVASDRE